MQRLTVGEHDVVRNVNNVVDRTQADGRQAGLQPLGRLLHLAAGDADAGVTATSLSILDDHVDGEVVVVDGETIDRGAMERGLVAVLAKPGVEIAGNTPVAQCVGTVGGDVHLYEPVALQVIILGGRHTYHSVVRQYDDTVVRRTNTNLVLSTNHAARLHAAQFRLLDDELVVAVVEHTAQVGHNHFLTSCHVGGAAHNLARFALAQINSRHMQVVAIGMGFARQHLANIESLQSTTNALHLFECVDLQTC